MPSTFLLQGQYMNLNIYDGFKIPATSLNIFDCLVILLLIQLMERCIYPLCHGLNFNLTPLRRMGIGMMFAIFSMLAAGILERHRKQTVDGTIINEISTKTYNASRLSVFYQVPQSVFMGCGEVFTSISGNAKLEQSLE